MTVPRSFVRNIKKKHLQTRQFMRGATNSKLLSACETGCSCCKCSVSRIAIFVPHSAQIFKRNYREMDLQRKLFFDEATFHVSGKVNGHNVRVWGTQNAHESVDVSDSSKVNYVIDSDSTKRLVVYQSERSAILTSFVRYKYLAINTRLHSSDNS